MSFWAMTALCGARDSARAAGCSARCPLIAALLAWETIAWPLAFLSLCILAFFRDPERVVPIDDLLTIARHRRCERARHLQVGLKSLQRVEIGRGDRGGELQVGATAVDARLLLDACARREQRKRRIVSGHGRLIRHPNRVMS